jgi:hypothetical protein
MVFVKPASMMGQVLRQDGNFSKALQMLRLLLRKVVCLKSHDQLLKFG